MSLNTYPNNPFPPSTEQMHRGDNEELQAQIDAIKDGTTIDSFADVERVLGTKTDNDVIAPEFDAESGIYAIGDLVMYEGKLYEFTTAHETAGDWNSEEVTEKTVADEVDSLKSGFTNVAVSLSVPEGTGKNLLPMTLDYIKSINTAGTWADNVYTFHDVTYTVTADAEGRVIKITADGTSDSGHSFFIANNVSLTFGYDTILNGSQSGASTTTARLRCNENYNDDGAGVTIPANTTITKVDYRVYNGYQLSNVDIYPMLRNADIANATFAPYIPSVEARLAALEATIAQLTNG